MTATTPDPLRDATLAERDAADREALAAEPVMEWDSSFIRYTAANGSDYRVELEPLDRQFNLSNGTVRSISRESPPLPPGALPWSWASLTAPGAIWQFQAGYRQADARKFQSPSGGTSIQVPYPVAVSRALEMLRQARMRAQTPAGERVTRST